MDMDFIDAVENGDVEEVSHLLEQGSDVDAREETFGGTALFLSAFMGNCDLANVLLNAGAHVDAKSHKGHTPLMAASFKGHIDLVQLLVSRGADLNAVDEQGRTALFEACRGNCADVTRLLIDANADLDAEDDMGRTALTLCAMEGREQPAAFL